MLLLALDTATTALSVAILDAEGPRAALFEARERGQAERLMPMIAEALEAAKVTPADLTRLAVTVGPGSFTGVRIGVAAARGFALARNIPVLPVTTMALAAAAVAPDAGPFTLLLPAGKGDVYAQDFAGPLTPASPIRLTHPAAVVAAAPARLVGTASLCALADPDGRLPHLDPGAPDARHMGALANNAAPGDWTFAPEPLYIRPPDAIAKPGPFRIGAA